MDEEIYKKYLKAGRIAKKARLKAKKIIEPGKSYLEVVNTVEKIIKDNGAGLAFPVNLSVNEIAAHYTPHSSDKKEFKKGEIVKIDVGAHVDGYIADTAETIEVENNKYDRLIDSSKKALESVLDIIKPGLKLRKIGKTIEETINSYGFNSIDNLTGHSLGKHNLHSGLSIPNTSQISATKKLKQGDAVAIEPFATDGKGHVVSGEASNIYICQKSMKSRLVRDKRYKIIYERLKRRTKNLPFSQRKVVQLSKNSRLILRRLEYLGLVRQYPQLIEQNKGIVTQKEHTIIVEKDGCTVTTQ
ncbi:MAG: type II methionyl aminopeptidase [Candidatus Thermoplasmatota archaeon]